MVKRQLNDSIPFNISRIALLLRRDLLHTLRHFNVTPEQWEILSLLSEMDNKLSQKEIAGRLLKDKHTISRMINSLVTKKWIKKDSSKTDSRVTLISLTKEGVLAQEEMRVLLSNSVKTKIFNNFSKKEKDNALKFLKDIRVILNDMDPQ